MYIVVEHEEGLMAKVLSQHKSLIRANEAMIMAFQKELAERGIVFSWLVLERRRELR